MSIQYSHSHDMSEWNGQQQQKRSQCAVLCSAATSSHHRWSLVSTTQIHFLLLFVPNFSLSAAPLSLASSRRERK